jgi:hypothetical protein
MGGGGGGGGGGGEAFFPVIEDSFKLFPLRVCLLLKYLIHA